jgi:thermostable 8-oxoguanine DNA glycosylase
VVGIFCRLDDFVPIVEIGKDLAMRNPDLFFVVIAPNFRFTKSIEMLKKIKEGNRPADYIERNRNAIALYGDIDDLIAQKWGKTYGYWEKKAETLVKNGEYLENYFKSMHSMGVRDPYEYKERLEKTMWLLLADLRAKARW